MDVSVIVPTYNRCTTLKKALAALAAQEAPEVCWEVIVVDNNSGDSTKEAAQSFVEKNGRFRYVFEPRQGSSYARNTGAGAARADVMAFTDDDVEVTSDWIRKIHEAALEYPDAEFLGGKIVPRLSKPLPGWAHVRMAPFAAQELGERSFRVSREYPRVLILACLIIRRRALTRTGLFIAATQRVKDGIGSTEDADWESTVWKYGGYGIYIPEILCYTEIPPDRIAKSYHRKWHFGHGKFNAVGRRSNYEGGAWRLLDVPAFMYRQSMEAGVDFMRLLLKGRRAEAFERECDLLFYCGFLKERWTARILPRRVRPSQ